MEDKDKELMLVSPSHDASVASPAAPAAATVNLLDVRNFDSISTIIGTSRLPTTDVTSEHQAIGALQADWPITEDLMDRDKDTTSEQTQQQHTKALESTITSKQQELTSCKQS